MIEMSQDELFLEDCMLKIKLYHGPISVQGAEGMFG